MKAVTGEQIRDLDQRTIAAGTPGEELMERAGYAVAKAAAEFLKKGDARSVLLFAGKGNNGGDAIVAARHLAGAGCHPTLILLCQREELQGDPLLHFQRLVSGVDVFEMPGVKQMQEIAAEAGPAVVVDGLLGTGLKSDVREPYASAIRFINQLQLPVVAIDIPSGIDSDTGAARGVCMRADVTVTMGLPKIGLLQPAAADYVGRIEVADIGFPRQFVEEVQTAVDLLVAADVKPLLPRRRPTAHKGDFGHLLIVAGSEGYTGAPVLCAHAAARAGAGLVTLAVPRAIYSIVAANCPPEIMPQPLQFEQLDAAFLSAFDAVAVGPGLGQRAETQKTVEKLVAGGALPMVIDADALNAVAQDVAVLKKSKSPIVLTPHPGEMGRLIGKTAKEVQAHRWDIAQVFAQEHGVVTVLKGAGTVVADKSGKLWINSTGNPGMAKGGMGDALTGMIGAFLAQGLSALDAARVGVFLHGLAGDVARERYGEQALLAGDLILGLSAAFAALD
jgi:NAD(P)H-hydrate epimerase